MRVKVGMRVHANSSFPLQTRNPTRTRALHVSDGEALTVDMVTVDSMEVGEGYTFVHVRRKMQDATYTACMRIADLHTHINGSALREPLEWV